MKNKSEYNYFAYIAWCLFGIFILLSGKINAQQSNVPLNNNWIQEVESKMVQSKGFVLNNYLMKYEADSAIQALVKYNDKGIADPTTTILFPVHTAMRPWLEQGHPIRKNILLQNSTNEQILFHVRNRWPAWFLDYHSKSSLFQVEKPPGNGEPLFRLYVDPLANIQMANMRDDENDTLDGLYYTNTRGLTAHGDIGPKLSFETSFYENQTLVPKYVKDFAKATLVIPGQGRWKAFKITGYDYAMATGYISYSPVRAFNIQIGSGKHFVGDGYRSLLLSDNSFSYPYARLTGWFGPNKMFQYTTIYASLMNLYANAPIPIGTERLYQKKAATFYELSANIGRIAEISLFQGLIWTAADAKNKQCIQLPYVNPLIFSSIPIYGLSDRHNFLLGANFHVDLFRTLRLYGQFVLDDLGQKGKVGDKKGFQLGGKYFNAFKLKHVNLELEYNGVNPFTYSSTDARQAYTHYNQPLAHPLGANFSEVIFRAQYKCGDFFFHLHVSNAIIGADTAGINFGQNVFTSDGLAYVDPITGNAAYRQGDRTSLTFFDASVGFMISYASNLNVVLGITDRKALTDETYKHTQYVYLAIRTSLTNNYLDFFR